MFASRIYKYSPLIVQEGLITARDGMRNLLREEKHFLNILEALQKTQYLTSPSLQLWHVQHLSELLHRALTLVPYYQRLNIWPEAQSEDIFKQLQRFPILTKQHVILAKSDLLASDVPRWGLYTATTSGTTGTPLTIYQTLNAIRRENAFVWRQLQWAGYQKGQRRVWLRGEVIVPTHKATATYWRMNHAANMLMMSSYHLSQRTARSYLEALRRFDPSIIQAYPSSISYLANWLWHQGERIYIPSLKSIVTSSETLTQDQRERITATFGVPVFDWYGNTERTAAIGTCEHGRQHVIEDYGFTELIPADQGLYEIVGTSYHHLMMPLIRYATGDVVELENPDAPCECGRAFRVVKRVVGRMGDALKTPDGRSISLLAMIYEGLAGIAEAQIVQKKTDAVEIRVVPANGSDVPQQAKTTLYNRLRDRLGQDMEIKVVSVESLPRTANGKLKPIISNI